ncbi:MAG: ATP-dependent Clp protease ATP-binding subunit [Clostridia bacterium]|nr:ATP-dependent Clp protease ATP-binding subunit [Clostridia bacterium]
MMLCTRCKKNRAVVFVKKLENGKQYDEGYCLSCAKELGIAPIDDMMQKMGLSAENMEDIEGQIADMMDMFESGDLPEDFGPLGAMGFFPMGNDTPKNSFDSTKSKDKNKSKKKSLLDTYGVNLNNKAKKGEIDRVIGRDKELYRVIQILNRRTKNNPALIGEPGVGKTAIAESLALRIVEKKVPAKLLEKEVYLLDFTSVVAGTQFRGQFEARVKSIISETIDRGNVILVIDEIHNIVGSGSANDGALSAANILKPSLSRGEIQVIGATTLSEYRKYIEKDAALERRFQPVMVEEPSVEETIDIIKGIKEYYETHHKIIVTDDIIRQAVVLSKRFIQGRFLPDKAIDVIDEAGSKANLENETLTKLIVLRKELKEVEAQKEDAASTDSIEDYQKAADLKSRECKLKEEIEALEQDCQSTVLTSEDIARVIEMWTNVPVKKITEIESGKLMNLDENLKKKVIGQDEAISVLAKAIRRKRAGVDGRLRPASFIFVGPTGVGKTELVKVLAEEMFGSVDDLIRLDMTEYQEQHSVSKMIGSPPGYVGYEEAGQLTEKVRRHPYSVVLFDEIEKAHPGVYNILLQILDEGRLTDAQGRVVSFENTIIILTSNAGIGFGTETLGFGANSVEEEVAMNKLKQIFKPELLNRLDEIIVFNRLKTEDFEKICKIILSEIENSLLEKGITLSVTENAIKQLAKIGYSEKYGARELRRIINRNIGNQIAEKVISDEAKFGSVLKVDFKNEFLIKIK